MAQDYKYTDKFKIQIAKIRETGKPISAMCKALNMGGAFTITKKNQAAKILDLCQYFGQKKLKDYAIFLIPYPPFEARYVQTSFNIWI